MATCSRSIASRSRREGLNARALAGENSRAQGSVVVDGLVERFTSSAPGQIPSRMRSNDEAARRLATVPGIWPINATALVSAVGDASAFRRARDLVAWLGLVPKQATTGGKPKLLGITKRGSRYLRKNLIHGARAVLPRLMATQTRLGEWLRNLLARSTQEHRDRGTCCEAGEDRMGGAGAWRQLRSGDGCQLTKESIGALEEGALGSTRSAGGGDRDGLTVDRQHGSPIQ